jgi:rRNA maturation endonuclease Nob1
MICNQCGEIVTEGYAFCTSCGSRLEDKPDSGTDTSIITENTASAALETADKTEQTISSEASTDISVQNADRFAPSPVESIAKVALSVLYRLSTEFRSKVLQIAPRCAIIYV